MNFDRLTTRLFLGCRPVIAQTGLGVHECKREETFMTGDEWQMHLYYWNGSFSYDKKVYPVSPKSVSFVPPGKRCTWYFPEERCVHHYIHFRLKEQEPIVTVPFIRDISENYSLISYLFETIAVKYTERPLEAEVALWHLLWTLSASGETTAPFNVRPGAVETVKAIVRSELSTPLNTKRIAARLGVSVTHLNRLFKQHDGMTVFAYLTEQRLNFAKNLLMTSNLPIRTIASRVGIPNLQHFNKYFRRSEQLSPTRWRLSRRMRKSNDK